MFKKLVVSAAFVMAATGAFAVGITSAIPTMQPERSIAQNTLATPQHSTFAMALKQAGLFEMLEGGAYTLFAPTDRAFFEMDRELLSDLFEPEHSDDLKRMLLCHLVTPSALTDATAKNGALSVRTLGDCTLQLALVSERMTVQDERGNVATVVTANMAQSNGVLHVVDAVLLPADERFPFD